MSVEPIVVGVDGSEGAQHAVNWAIDYAREGGAQVLVVHALSPLIELALALLPFDFNRWRDDVREEFHQKWCAPLREAGVSYLPVTVEDYPAPALMRVAEDKGAALIVVGAHGHGGFTDRVAGGVVIKLVQHARTPVVVIPPER